MKLNVKKCLTGGVFSVRVDFKNYEVFEEGLMEDFGVPELLLPVSTWGATAEDNSGAIELSEIELDKDEPDCSIDITSEIKAKLDNTFHVEYSVKIADLEEAEEEMEAPLDSVVKIAEAKCALFIEVIKQEAKAKMDKLRAMKTDFEAITKNPETIKV